MTTPPMSGKMDAELKAKWLEALRSGKYEQERGHIGRKNKLCCLGVLSIVSGAPRNKDNVPKILFWQDLIGKDPGKLIAMNDGNNNKNHEGAKPFNEIADYIEQNL